MIKKKESSIRHEIVRDLTCKQRTDLILEIIPTKNCQAASSIAYQYKLLPVALRSRASDFEMEWCKVV
uniref:Uncharacterized protein n=1 Tax=Setaria digitata TaxID=48799 RepID=A0A915PTJ6_9BILA